MSKRLARMGGKPARRLDDRGCHCSVREFDIACDPPRGGGSHYKLSHPAVPEILTVPFKRPIKPPVYIRKLVSFVEALRIAK